MTDDSAITRVETIQDPRSHEFSFASDAEDMDYFVGELSVPTPMTRFSQHPMRDLIRHVPAVNHLRITSSPYPMIRKLECKSG